jgi:hypothetical protein
MEYKKYWALILSFCAIVFSCAKGPSKQPLSVSKNQSFLDQASGKVFISLCPSFGDSLLIFRESMQLYERGSKTPSLSIPLEDTLADTLFYGVISFIGHDRDTDSAKYWVGYTHRGGRKTWDDAMFLPFVPKEKWVPGSRYSFTDEDFKYCEAD